MIGFREELSKPGIGFFTKKTSHRFLRMRKLIQYQCCYNNVKRSGEFHLRDDRKRTSVRKLKVKGHDVVSETVKPGGHHSHVPYMK